MVAAVSVGVVATACRSALGERSDAAVGRGAGLLLTSTGASGNDLYPGEGLAGDGADFAGSPHTLATAYDVNAAHSMQLKAIEQ